MTKKLFLALLIAVVAVAMATAQQISAVSENGVTSLYTTLAEAIEGAEDGSVIYLPGGSFPLDAQVRVTKRLTIIGIGHRSDNDNADGVTIISGDLRFMEGSSGSAVIGCYITGHVLIGEEGSSVNNVLVRYCNFHAVVVNNNTCLGTTINQNYIRFGSYFRGGAPGTFTNNVAWYVMDLDNGVISNNIMRGYHGGNEYEFVNNSSVFIHCDNCLISNNIIINNDAVGCGSGCTVTGNMRSYGVWGDNPINLGGADWNDVFVNYNNGAISPVSDFHFKEEYQQYSSCGIYGGTGFNDKQKSAVPYIVSKQVDDQTDASGKLNMTIKVKAGE